MHVRTMVTVAKASGRAEFHCDNGGGEPVPSKEKNKNTRNELDDLSWRQSGWRAQRPTPKGRVAQLCAAPTTRATCAAKSEKEPGIPGGCVARIRTTFPTIVRFMRTNVKCSVAELGFLASV